MSWTLSLKKEMSSTPTVEKLVCKYKVSIGLSSTYIESCHVMGHSRQFLR